MGAVLTVEKAGGGPLDAPDAPAVGRITDENCGGGCAGSRRVAEAGCGEATTDENDGGAAAGVATGGVPSAAAGSSAGAPLARAVPGDHTCTFALSGTCSKACTKVGCAFPVSVTLSS